MKQFSEEGFVIDKKVKLVMISNTYFNMIKDDSEILNKPNERACLLIVKMYYRGNEYKFLIPWRSNVPSVVGKQKDLVYKLPPTTHTKNGFVACLDFRKSIIVPKNCNNAYTKFNIVEDRDKKSIRIIERNLNKIIESFSRYLKRYEHDKNNIRFSVDIDRILRIVKDNKKGLSN